MKIVQINTTASLGSTGRFVQELSEALPGVSKELRITRNEKPTNRKLQHPLETITNSRFDLLFHGLLSRCWDAHGLGSKAFTKKVVKRIKKFNPDVIFMQNIHGYFLNYPLLFSYLKESNVKVVWTLFDCWAFTGHCAFFSHVKCEKYKTGCGQCPQYKSYPKSLIDKSSFNFLRKTEAFSTIKNLSIVTHSHWLQSLVNQSLLKVHSSCVIHNGVNIDQFTPKSSFSDNKLTRILAIANIWTKRKGLSDLIKLHELIDSNQYELAIVGLNSDQVKSLPEDVIKLPKSKDIDTLVRYYQSADILVNPTYDDNFPTVNIEALACGLPVVTYNTGGSPEAVDEGTGFVVEQGDVMGLLDAINALNQCNKVELSAKCRERAVANFNQSKQLLEYAKIAGCTN